MNDHHLTKNVFTNIPFGNFKFSEKALQEMIVLYLPEADKIEPTHGVIKEAYLTAPGKLGMEKPAKMGKENFQAFIIERAGDEITADQADGKKDFFLNGRKLGLSFVRYDVRIIKI
jgi:hypothetical protein